MSRACELFEIARIADSSRAVFGLTESLVIPALGGR